METIALFKPRDQLLPQESEKWKRQDFDLYAPIPHRDGRNILREALLVADHNAYPLGALVTVLQVLGAWK